jgi:hypothetical protein
MIVAASDDELLGLVQHFHKLINEFNVKTHVVILGGITSRSDVRDVAVWENELTTP